MNRKIKPDEPWTEHVRDAEGNHFAMKRTKRGLEMWKSRDGIVWTRIKKPTLIEQGKK